MARFQVLSVACRTRCFGRIAIFDDSINLNLGNPGSQERHPIGFSQYSGLYRQGQPLRRYAQRCSQIRAPAG